MNSINLTSNRLIHNIIVAFDFIALWGVMYVTTLDSYYKTYNETHYFITASLAMALAQMGFSTILHHHYSRIDRMLSRTTALATAFMVIWFAINMAVKYTDLRAADNRSVILVSLYMYVVLIAIRLIETFIIKVQRKRGRNSRAVLFVGETSRIEDIMEDMDRNVASGLRYCGYYAPEESAHLTQYMPYKGNYDDAQALLQSPKRVADEIYCALPESKKELSKHLIHYCMSHVMHFYYVPTFISEFGEYLRPSVIGEQVVFANFTEPLLDPSNRLMKRVFDICASALAIIVLLPFLPIVALIIKCCSPGPIFFRQARTGIGGKDFMMLKFRSMHVNKDCDKLQATKNDPRKYAFGSFMRKTSIDELPQLWNIFVGDMSVVGPRPHMRQHTEQYSQLIDDYMLRHYIRPGLTGWAQTTGFRGETDELWKMEGRVRRDIWYIQNWTFWLDIRIILRTVKQVIMKDKQAY